MNTAAKLPRYIGIETINTCNARCPFCPLFQGNAPMSRELRPARVMQDELFDRIIRQISDWHEQLGSLFLNMNGEPLQDPFFTRRLQVAARYALGPKIELQTNGQFLDEKAARAILEAQVGRVVLGFDGATRQTYEAHRVRCDYERVLNNLRRFVEMRQHLGGCTQVAIQFVRTTRNVHEVVQAYEMFSQILSAELDLFQDNISKDWGDVPATEDIFYVKKHQERGKPSGCLVFNDQMIIHSDGKVAACCWDYNLTVSDGGLGDANVESLATIWSGDRRGDLARRLSSDDIDEKPEKCKECPFLFEMSPLPVTGAMISDAARVSSSPFGYVYRFPARAAAT
jgi:radical SAM protein with 4Fe4S-binding SPASM domain